MRSIRSVYLFVLLTFFTTQVDAQVKVGTPPFGSYSGGPDVVNLANLNVHWTYPILHKEGRGTNFNYDLRYDTSVWTPVAGHWTLASGWTTSILPLGYLKEKTTYTSGAYTNGQRGKYSQTIDTFTYVDASEPLTPTQHNGVITADVG